jgi:hypothetical protein
MESDKMIKIEGEGHLINNDSSKRYLAKFEVEQIQTGKISGKCTLSGFKYEDILTQSQFKKSRITSGNLIKINGKWYEFKDVLYHFRNVSLEGKTDNRDTVIVKKIFTHSIEKNSSRPGTLNLEFSASEVDIDYEAISTEDQLRIKYGIINLDLRRHLQGYIKSDIGKITFSKRKDHDKTINKMKTFKTPLLSGFLNITDVNMRQFESFDSYFETIKKPVETVLELLSLAQSTYLSYCSICIYAKTPNSNSQDEYKLKRMIMLDIKTKVPSLKPPLITDWNDIYNFISPKTIQKYTDLRDKCGLSIAFEWYLESLSHGVLQSDFLLACTCLEILKDRYNKKKGNTYILPESEFEDYLPDLKTKIKDMLKEKGVNNKKAKKISGKLKCINRTSFENSLLRLLEDLKEDQKIIYNDLFDQDPKIEDIMNIRNQITHTGILDQEVSIKKLSDVNQKLICLIQRIFLALLEYDGSFLDHNAECARRKFPDLKKA